jgi:hypothetical protein
VSGADDLRTADAVIELAQEYRAHGLTGLRQWMTDPKNALAILNLIGEVREGMIVHSEYDGHGAGHHIVRFGTQEKFGTPGYVVRPRGEATDA